jgi:hypothetical protein
MIFYGEELLAPRPTPKLEGHPLSARISKPEVLPMVLYGCEARSLALREEHRLRVFENRMLRRIFGPKRDEVTRGWE